MRNVNSIGVLWSATTANWRRCGKGVVMWALSCGCGLCVQHKRKLERLARSVDTTKEQLDGLHKEHGRLKTEEQVGVAWGVA